MQKTTLFLVLLALGLGGYVYFNEIHSPPPEETTTSAGETLFNFEQNQVQRLTIKREEETLAFIRSDEGWEMKEPEENLATESSIIFLLDLLVGETSSQTFSVEKNQLENYGLHDPLASIEIVLEDETKYQLLLGNLTFNEEEVYAQINPENNSNPEIKVLPVDFISSVERPLSEWKQQTSEAEEETKSN